MASSKKTEKQNMEFMDLYKSVDNSIKKILGTDKGITEYINILELKAQGSKSAPEIRQDLKMLKHLRWVRNKLAHEVDYGTQILEAGDGEWLESFQKRMRKGKLPVRLTFWDRIRRLFSKH